MTMHIPDLKEIIELEKKYLNKRIELILMPNDPDAIEPGAQGVCFHVDAMGQLLIKWDNGRSLSLIPGTDQFKVV